MPENNNCENCLKKEKKIQKKAVLIRALAKQLKETSEVAEKFRELCKCSDVCFPVINILEIFNYQLEESKGAYWKTLIIFRNIILNIEKERKKDKLCDEHRQFLENIIEKNTKWYHENC